MNALQGAVVAVTGAGRGLGAALAIHLAQQGASLVLCGRRRTALESTAERIRLQGLREAMVVEMDLSDAESVQDAVGRITRQVPVVDILINNGSAWLAAKESDFTPGEVAGVVNSAVTGTFLLIQGLLPLMRRSSRPDVVTIGSISALPNAPIHDVSVPFYAAKRAQAALAEGLRQRFIGTALRSICIHPPWLDDTEPGTDAWEGAAMRTAGDRATTRDVVEAVQFAITRPRNVTIASLVLDADADGLDVRTHSPEG